MYFLYSLLLVLGAAVTFPYWLYKGLRERKYLSNFKQRLGFGLPQFNVAPRPLLIHAVSVGEVLAAKALCDEIRVAFPNLPTIITTVTITGQSLARKTLAGAGCILYFPFDFAFSVKRFLERLRPQAVVIMETELWPNFLRHCRKSRIPVLLANGRISDKSYLRYRRIRLFTRRMLANIRVLGTQSKADRDRFVDLGACAERVHVIGNLKFDFPTTDIAHARPMLELISTSLRLTPQTPVIVVGSSMKGEEPLFLQAFQEVCRPHPLSRLILAPRHPERFSEVSELIRACGLPFTRRTKLTGGICSSASILLLDTIGELCSVYSLASVAVIGGSFLPFGGHNPLEPAVFSKAIVFGPHMSNFRDMAALFLKREAARQASEAALGAVLIDLLNDNESRSDMGRRAISAVHENQGATARTIELMRPYIS